MCLSTVYRDEMKPENQMMQNVMLIECRDGIVKLTDIMGRELEIEGEVAMADLTGGMAIVRPRAQA